MAQAARLNLRMQKELKLLIADPPPGATFPSLSSHSSVVSLSSIDAQIKGPEGSVYEKGIFKLKIRIPERYPFQPPSVTFVTPIYHPNIDTGGRICLDILNLPPKGAWQPSLNISTVLTSIGLLLSEPNPDDGLMHEASREHKYNRQVFDQKARSMTEKYAVVGAKVENVAQGSQIIATSSTELGEAKEFDSSTTLIHDHSLSQKRNFEVSRKLSLESSDFDATRNDGKVVNEVPTCNLDDSHVEILQLKQRSEATLIEHEKVHKDLQDPRKKLSLGLLVPVQKKNDDNIIDVMPISTISQHHIPMDPTKSRPSVQPGFSSQQHLNADKNGKLTLNVTETKLKRKLHKPTTSLRQGTGEDDKKLLFAPQQSAVQFSSDSHHTLIPGPQTTSKQNVVDGQGSSFPRIKHKKLGLSGRRLSQEKLGWNQCPQMNNKGNMAPNSGFSLSHIQKKLTSSSEVSEAGNSYNNSGQISTNSSSTLSGTGQIKTSNPSESADGKNIGLQLEIQSEYQSRPPSMQNDGCNDEKQQLKDYGERFTSEIKVQEETSPSADDDAIIVLDSEDSEEEQDRTKSSKLSLARRRFTGKRKSQNTNLTIRENTREILKTVSQ